MGAVCDGRWLEQKLLGAGFGAAEFEALGDFAGEVVEEEGHRGGASSSSWRNGTPWCVASRNAGWRGIVVSNSQGAGCPCPRR